MRTDLRNTLDPELDLYDTAFMSYSLPPVSGCITPVLTIHSKVARGITLRGVPHRGDMVKL